MKLLSKRNVYQAPAPGTLAYELMYHSHSTGHGKARIRMIDISDDIHDNLEVAFSDDNGKTWPRALPIQLGQQRPDGVLRRSFTEFFVDPENNRHVLFTVEGMFRKHQPGEGYANYYLRYRTSEGDGTTALVDERVIQKNHSADHPMPGQWVGHNGVMNAGGHSIIKLPDGKLMAGLVRTILSPDGTWWNPGGHYGFLEILILFGKWSTERDGAIDWTAGPTISIDTARSPRGIFEPTLAIVPDGRILLVARGSNGGEQDPDHTIASHKWACVSSDGGATWTDPQPWTYDDGRPFYSSSSISTFVDCADGELYWVGHVSDQNCQANMPRDHLYIGKVDQKSLTLIRDSVTLIDSRQPGEAEVQISCMMSAYEDRLTGDIVVHVPRFMRQSEEQWGGDTYEYRLSRE